MVTLTAEQIKNEPGTFIEQLQAGNEVLILLENEQIASVIPGGQQVHRPLFGKFSGRIIMSDTFDDPLPEF
jgi:antitoxin (DNA-binding transcriptional repressor) of toxin-antitoxin stability system